MEVKFRDEAKENISRVIVSHDGDSGLLTIICTPNLEEMITAYFKELCLMEYLQAERTIEDNVTEEGVLFKYCIGIRFHVDEEEVEVFFEAAKKALSQSISKSINHIDN